MVDSALLNKYGFKEEIEERQFKNYGPTGFPEPCKRYHIIAEDFNMSLEERYFFVLNYLREENGFADVEKLADVFSASENSSFFGASQQRLGLQQDKVSNFLATIGKMVKELFQLVRELRIHDERLSYYSDSYKEKSESRESAEITLKGIWVDMVEQGSKNPASVYGMARELGFTTLPDLFFAIHPVNPGDVDKVVDSLDFNRKLKEVLKRKLRSYLEWKKSTYAELKNKRRFTLKYLRQHFDIIKMYMNWTKPYLRNIRRLQMDRHRMNSPDMISAFENSFIEVELLFRKKFKTRHSCILVHFDFRTYPLMNYQQEYNKGPLHVGRIDMTIRAYGWNDEELKKYRQMKAEEDFQLLSYVDNSVKVAMESLGDELIGYLKEAGETFDDDPNSADYLPDKKSKKSKSSPTFGSVGKGFSQTFGSLFSMGITSGTDDNNKASAEAEASRNCWSLYKDYKKAFRHLAW